MEYFSILIITISIDFGNSEDDFTYDEYLKYRGDYDEE